MSERKLRIYLGGPLEVTCRASYVLGVEPLDMEDALQEGVVCLRIDRPGGCKMLALLGTQLHTNLIGNLLHRPGLDEHDVLDIVLEPGRPHLLVPLRVVHSQCNADTAAIAQHRSLDDPRHPVRTPSFSATSIKAPPDCRNGSVDTFDVTRRLRTRDRPSISDDCIPDTKYCSSGFPDRSSNGNTAIEKRDIESLSLTAPRSIWVPNCSRTESATAPSAVSSTMSNLRKAGSKPSPGWSGGVRVMPSIETS